MNIVIFGANGSTGRLLTAQALAEGNTVTALTRHPETFPIEHENLTVLTGDVFDAASVEKAVAGQDAVLSVLGVPFGNKAITTYSESMKNIVTAMDRQGVRRLACVSSSAADPAVRFASSGGNFFFEKILKPIVVFTFGRTTYEDMRRMEAIVTASDLDWTIARPSGLFDLDDVTDYQVEESHIRGMYTSRRDLADFMLRQASDETYSRRVAALATFDSQPSMMQLIRQEALAGGKK